jgi:hypothetical protein
MAEEETDERRAKDLEVLRKALDNLYGKGPEADSRYDDPLVFFRQLRGTVRKWLESLTDEDVETLQALGRQHQTVSTAWRRTRKLVAWMGASILATLAFGDQALRFATTLRNYLW